MKKQRYQDQTLTARERANDLLSLLTLEEKIRIITSRDYEVPRLGVGKGPGAVEIARGLVQRDQKRESTILPQPWGMAAMFDDDLMEKLGAIAGDEVRISSQMEEKPSGTMLFGPTVDMERDPRWGRNEEAYGEDPYLVGRMAGAYGRGLIGNDPQTIKTAPLLKHFYANNYENERQTTNANITPRMKYEYYLKPFETIIREGGAVGLMTAYNCINGVEAINNPDVSEICKKEWGMTFAVSDGGDFGQNVAAHRTFKTHAESIAAILGVGADMMLDSREMVEPAIREALQSGLLSESQLDKALRDTLELRFLLGEFDDGHIYTHMDKSGLACGEHKQLAVEAAEKSMILLENHGLLPLKDDGTCKVAIVGPLSNENYTCWYCGYAKNQTPVVKGFIQKLGESRVLFDGGLDHVVIKSKASGKYISLASDGKLIANADTAEAAEVFERNDWDYGSWTLRSLTSGKYVTEDCNDTDMPLQDAKIHYNYSMFCKAEEAFGWFVKEHIKVETDPDGTVYLKSWQNRPLIADDSREIISISTLPQDGRDAFVIEVISSGKERAASLAAKADYCVVCAGNHPLINAREEYDRPDINLPCAQSSLLEAVCQSNINTLLYLVTGYPFAIVKEKDMAKAVLTSTHLGPCLGHVAAATIFGDNIPAGRTPSTWYRSVRELPALEDYDIIKNNMTYLYYKGEALYPFGHGLSYTHFSYSSASLDKDHYNKGDGITVTVDIKNTGPYDGDEVVQLYIVPAKSYYKRPVKMLRGFRRVTIKSGETVKVKMTVSYKDLAFWSNEDGAYVVDAGEYGFQIGASSADIREYLTASVDGEKVIPRNGFRGVEAIDTEDYSGVQFLTDKNDGQPYIEGKGIVSYAVYPGFDLKEANAFEAIISSPSGQVDVFVANHRTGEILAHYSGQGTGGLANFCHIQCDFLSCNEVTDIRICLPKHIAMKSFRFYNK